MEQREIIVANTKTQKKSKITTDASTLGELKAAFRTAGIDYAGMTFTEGISKTELLDDATQLPKDVMFKGQPTNNLVILLTNTKKNIASGVMSRKEAYAAIKDNNLQDAVKQEFGRNFTQVPTDNLITFIANHTGAAPKEASWKETPSAPEAPVDATDYNEEDIPAIEDFIVDARLEDTEDTLFCHIAMLVMIKAIDIHGIKALKADLESLIQTMTKKAKKATPSKKESVTTSDGSINEDDVQDMLKELGI